MLSVPTSASFPGADPIAMAAATGKSRSRPRRLGAIEKALEDRASAQARAARRLAAHGFCRGASAARPTLALVTVKFGMCSASQKSHSAAELKA